VKIPRVGNSSASGPQRHQGLSWIAEKRLQNLSFRVTPATPFGPPFSSVSPFQRVSVSDVIIGMLSD